MHAAITDANSEARMRGRRAFLSWYTQSPNSAENLYKILDYSVQKAIMEERDQLGMSDLSLDTAASQNMSRSGAATNLSSGSLQNNSYIQPKK